LAHPLRACSLDTANEAFTFCFTAEAAFKIAALGRAYFTDAFNLFDLVVTIACLVDVFLPSSSGSFGGLRAIRILRLLRMLTVLPVLQRFMRVLVKVLRRTLSFFCIVAVLGE